jgi:branched-chain amino acid transport system substrate-binding protein
MKDACKRLLVLGALLCAPMVASAQTGPVKIFGLVELSGGGILGRRIDYTSSDTQSSPQIAKALAQQAVDQDAYVVLGPVFSGSIMVSMAETRRAEVPNFTGGEAAGITEQGNPYIFRTSFTQATAMPKVARYLKDTVKAKTVALMWINNDFGKGGRDVMTKALDAQGIRVAADISTDPGQVDFSGPVLKAKQVNADALFVYLNEDESARVLRELRKQGYDKPIVGETTITGQKVIENAGEAANGVIGHVGLSADAPLPTIKAFDEKFQKEWKHKADHNGLKGYTAVYIIKAITEKVGKFDRKAFAAAMHGAKITAKENPGVLMDVSFDKNGDLDRESFMTRVENGKQVVFAVLPPASAK